ncbi:MAG: radical SAM/SPASM domain-containing protein [Bacteroidota bacterium]|jgi:radical SAM protein with 4Fe4S-binding SPASM domain
MMGKILDLANLFSRFTPARFMNALLVIVSYYLSRMMGKPIVWGMPVSIALEPTTACNLRCPQCPSGLKSFTRDTGNIKSATLEKALTDIGKTALYANLYFQGEPYIHKDFLRMVSLAKQAGLYTATSTNAHFIDDEIAKQTIRSGLDRLIISLDGLTQESYSSYRIGGELDKVILGTRLLVKWKKEMRSKTPYLIFQFLLTSHNEHEVSQAKAFADKMGVDEIRFKTAQVYDFQDGNALIPKNPAFTRYKQIENGKFRIKNKLYNHCWRMWQSPVITWDGYAVPCCFDKDASYRFGNINRSDFRSIWFSEPYMDFRKKIFRGRAELDICKNCSEGTRIFT